MTATTYVPRPAETVAGTTRRKGRRSRSDAKPAWGFLAPFLILYVLFVIGPAIYGLVMSFFDASLVKSGLGHFVGFDNYVEAFKSSDFWSSMWHTVWFTILTTPPLVILSFVFAVLAERAVHGRWFFRLAFFAPYILPSAVMALIWIWLYTPGLGLATAALGKIGITAPQWLGDPHWAMTSIAIATVWWTLGFNFVLYLAGLQDIPRELYESSAIDGASPW
ncbi:MAG TPA: sugar ABC transporter permease, partial [Jatrophihabitantaceae bacterium]